MGIEKGKTVITTDVVDGGFAFNVAKGTVGKVLSVHSNGDLEIKFRTRGLDQTVNRVSSSKVKLY